VSATERVVGFVGIPNTDTITCIRVKLIVLNITVAIFVVGGRIGD